MTETMQVVKQFILTRFLPGEDPSLLEATTPLITGGALDSLARLELVQFLEDHFQVSFDSHEVDPDRLDTLEAIDLLVRRKKGEPV